MHFFGSYNYIISYKILAKVLTGFRYSIPFVHGTDITQRSNIFTIKYDNFDGVCI